MANRSLPNFIIAGVPKAATTSLFMYLSAHPEICPSSIKEVQYFLPLRYGVNHLPPIKKYQQYFSHCQGADHKYIMEATAGYFEGGRVVAEEIKKQLGNVKIIVILRDPVERTLSFFKFEKKELRLKQNLSFNEYIKQCESIPVNERKKRENNTYWAIEGGFYSNYLEDWFAVFGKESLKIIFFEHLKTNPTALLQDLCLWLGIEATEFVNSLDLSIENKSFSYRSRLLQKIALSINWQGEEFWRKHPELKRRLRRLYLAINGQSQQVTISSETRSYLEEVFKPYNRKLAIELSKRGYVDFPEWLAQNR